MFDDVANLQALGDFAPYDNLHSLLYYATSGTADPTGRPLSVLSFLIDSVSWPAAPYIFKRNNVLLHLGNAILLYCVIYRLESRLNLSTSARNSSWTALLAATLWATHPLFVSTTLYVVQRHAMLPFSFAMLAFLSWDAGVQALERGKHKAALGWCIGMTGVFTLCAGLSKANGLLTPPLLLLMFAIVYAPHPGPNTSANSSPQINRIIKSALLAPTLLIAFMLASTFMSAINAGEMLARPWTMYQRTLTEPLILLDYLSHLLIPREGSNGLYSDDYVVAQGLMADWWVLPSAITLLGGTVAAWLLRSSHPRLALAALFFLVAHSMESFAVPLELYFEHRNYLPAALLFWPLAHWILNGSALRHTRAMLAVLLPGLLLLLTWQRASVWGDPELLSSLKVERAQESPRAQVEFASRLIFEGKASVALSRLIGAQRINPESIEIGLSRIGAECAMDQVTQDAIDIAANALESTDSWHVGVFDWLRQAIEKSTTSTCAGLSQTRLAELVEAAARNTHIPQNELRRQRTEFLRGLIAISSGDPERAAEHFDSTLTQGIDFNQALTQAAILGEFNRPDLGLRHLKQLVEHVAPPVTPDSWLEMTSIHRYLLHFTGYYAGEIRHLREQLTNDLASTTPEQLQYATHPEN